MNELPTVRDWYMTGGELATRFGELPLGLAELGSRCGEQGKKSGELVAGLDEQKGEGSMAARTGPTFIRLMLGAELTRLREGAGLTGEQAAKVAGTNTTTISNVEGGKSGFRRLEQFVKLLDKYGVESEAKDELTDWYKRSKEEDWWTPRISVMPSGMNLFLAFEGGADGASAYSNGIHGLLQGPAYARASVESAKAPDETTSEFVDSVVEIRTNRRKRITEDGLEFSCIMDEATFRTGVGTPAIMREQLRDIAELCDLPNVTVRIIPSAAMAYRAPGPFSIMTFDPSKLPGPVVSTDLVSNAVQFVSKTRSVRLFERRFEHMSRGAMPAQDTPKFLAKLVKEVWS
ncbi:helix-turn-helix transcriptional regulator [Streptomyces goshikiensis]|uniref:helix-turn-helix domain-containing protein n=1 Tax=Streptomyces goshikiensis TaxID=1942 RepID=UPI003402FD55